MKKVSSDRLKGLALAKGGTLEVDGEVFNSAKAKGRFTKPAPAAEPAPAPAPAPTLSIEDVQKLLAARDTAWKAELDRVVSTLKARPWDFNVSYGKEGRVENIKAKPL